MAPPLQVVVAGGGPAALATLDGLRTLARGHVAPTIVAPETDTPTLRHAARAARAELYGGRVDVVDGRRHEVRLADGRRVRYDVLVLAVGARRQVPFARARTFFGNGPDAVAVTRDRLVAELADGHVRSLAFVAPVRIGWTLPLYELALQTGCAAGRLGLDVPLRLLTPEVMPLELFGTAEAATLRAWLDESGVTFRGGVDVTELPGGVLREGRDGVRFVRERTVALARETGPALTGVPRNADGFVPVDELGAVRGLPDVFAAGACTAYPLRQQELAQQQGAAVARVVAQRAGVPVTATPWRPLVRGILDAGHGRVLTLHRGGRSGGTGASGTTAGAAAPRFRPVATRSPRAAAGGPCTSR
jgi:sulfide:quinone oxidoreductase